MLEKSSEEHPIQTWPSKGGCFWLRRQNKCQTYVRHLQNTKQMSAIRQTFAKEETHVAGHYQDQCLGPRNLQPSKSFPKLENTKHSRCGTTHEGKVILENFDLEMHIQNLPIWKALVFEGKTKHRKTLEKVRWAVFCRSVLPSVGSEVASSKVTSVSLLAMLGLPLPPLSYTYPTDVTTLWGRLSRGRGRGARKGCGRRLTDGQLGGYCGSIVRVFCVL